MPSPQTERELAREIAREKESIRLAKKEQQQ